MGVALALFGVSLRSLRFRRKAHRHVQRLRSDVGVLQEALMPAFPESIAALTASAAYRPAAGDVGGGDFFDAFQLSNGHAVIIIGDVSGHGKDVVQQTAVVHYGIRAWLREGASPRQALKRASKAFNEDLGESFATLLVCVYDPRSATLTWASAGHPPPFIIGAPFKPIVASSAPPIGLGIHTGQRQTSIALPSDAVICLYTDGLKEARTKKGEMLGAAMVRSILEQHVARDFSARKFLGDVSAHADTSADDCAAVLLRVQKGNGTDFWVEELEVHLEDGPELVRNFLEDGGLEEEGIGRCLAELEVERGRGSGGENEAVLLRFFPRSHECELRFVADHVRNPSMQL